jgi:acyl carrier protein
MEESVKEKIRGFALEAAQRKGLTEVADDESLTDNGVIDSLAIFRLVSFLQDSFGVRIADEEIVNENFSSINVIESFVAEKLKKKGAAA